MIVAEVSIVFKEGLLASLLFRILSKF